MNLESARRSYRQANHKAAQRLASVESIRDDARAALEGQMDAVASRLRERQDAEAREAQARAEARRRWSDQGVIDRHVAPLVQQVADARHREEGARAAKARASEVASAVNRVYRDAVQLEREYIEAAIAAAPRPQGAGTHVLEGRGAGVGFDPAAVAFTNQEVPDPIVPEGVTIESIREDIDGIAADIEKVLRAPQSLEESLAQGLAQVHGPGAPLVDVRIDERGVRVALPEEVVHAESATPGARPTVFDAKPMLFHLLGDELKQEVARQIREQYADVDFTVDAATRRRMLAELRTDLLDAERIECALIWAARERGEDAMWRRGTDPRAILGLKGPALQRRND